MARLLIDDDAFRHNLRCALTFCRDLGVDLLPVLKGAAHDPTLAARCLELAEASKDASNCRLLPPAAAHPAGLQRLAEACAAWTDDARRPPHLSSTPDVMRPTVRPALLTAPPPSRVEEVAALADRSYVAEARVLKGLAEAARRLARPHAVVLMVDMGDLREGASPAALPTLAAQALSLEHDGFRVAGVGTNFGCLTGLKPSAALLQRFALLVEQVETALGRRLETVSVGGSVLLPWLAEEAPPAVVTELRLGEALLLGCFQGAPTPLDAQALQGPLRRDVVTLEAEVLEAATKPGHPAADAALGLNAMGEPPDILAFPHAGARRRALLDFGLLDAKPWELRCEQSGVQYVGATSNYAVFDVEEAQATVQAGDRLRFAMGYESLCRAFHSPYVERLCRDAAACAVLPASRLPCSPC